MIINSQSARAVIKKDGDSDGYGAGREWRVGV